MTKTLTQPTQIQQVAADVLAIAKRNGATAAEVAITQSEGFSVQVRVGEVETLEHHRDKGIGISVYFGQRKGSSSSSAIDAESIREAVLAACHIAKFTSEDDCAGLAPKDRMASHYPDLKLHYPWHISPEQGIALAQQCEQRGREDKRITNSEGASLTTSQSLHVYANSNDFYGEYQTSMYNLSCTLIAQEQGHMQRDYGYTVARDPLDLATPIWVADEAIKRTVRRLGAKKLSTRKAPVIIAAEIAPGLLSSFLGAIRGSNLYRKSSYLLDSLGTQVFGPHIEIEENPHIIKGLASAPFDSEGVTTNPRSLVKHGILQGYILNNYTARKLGLTTTGNAGGVHNILVSTSDLTLNQLLQKMGTGLLVTEVMGQGVNMVTGDYSRGAAGFWVENGVIQYPVEEITIAGNLKDMFLNLVTIGKDIERRSSIQTGSILLEEMTIAGH